MPNRSYVAPGTVLSRNPVFSQPAFNLQQDLRSLGYSKGPIDGVYGMVAEAGHGPLRACQCPPAHPKYMNDCSACLTSAGTISIQSGVTPASTDASKPASRRNITRAITATSRYVQPFLVTGPMPCATTTALGPTPTTIRLKRCSESLVARSDELSR